MRFGDRVVLISLFNPTPTNLVYIAIVVLVVDFLLVRSEIKTA
ncbi:MAG: hypothetical protein NTU99_12285 [Pseudanabaena sp. LacPavin_0818_WC45_MAG_42_6]|jgi:hypothetical protein|nr:hypothetical protein [Pseudanabaena sp. LacPavin_0818_WC45_MAG_42_6]